MNRLRLAAAMWCLWLPCGAHAWGDEGHEIVALIADHYLHPDVRARMNLLLGTDQSGLCEDRGIAAESTWADRYRERHRDTQDWHYIDIETEDRDMAPAHGQLVAKIGVFRRELADPAASRQEHLLALQFLLHLIGDLHQPLHAADDRDHGGNDKQVIAQGERRGSLHHYWDTVFVGRLGKDATAVSHALIAAITPAEQAEAVRGTPASWALESFAIAKTEAYGRLPAARADGIRHLDERYVDDATRTVRHQLQIAGLRLSQVLNQALR
jgi:S1/P1 Nuclease